MNKRIIQNLTTWQYIGLLALFMLPAFAWLGVLDHLSSDQINDSISAAGVIYGTARGINALVSLLQGTELDMVFLTFSIGEVLDPVNDLIEQFSNVMLIALASLALQKILLTIVSHQGFNILITALAVCTGLSLLQRNTKASDFLWKLFLMTAFLRFSLGIVVLANGWVDAHFLNKADEERLQALQSFQADLRETQKLTKEPVDYAAAIPSLEQEIAQMGEEMAKQQATLDQTIIAYGNRIGEAEKHIKELQEKGDRLCRLSDLSPTCPEDVKKARQEVHQLKNELRQLKENHNESAAAVKEKEKELACLKKHQQGKSCGLLESLSNVTKSGALQAKLSSLNNNIGDFVENTIDLLTSALLKALIIPLLFFYLLLKLARTFGMSLQYQKGG